MSGISPQGEQLDKRNMTQDEELGTHERTKQQCLVNRPEIQIDSVYSVLNMSLFSFSRNAGFPLSCDLLQTARLAIRSWS